MLPRLQRVSKKLFESIIKASKTFHSPLFFIRVGFYDGKSLFSCIVSKKIDKRAVRRNYLRRKMYNSIKSVISRVKPGLVVVVFAKKGSESLGFEEIKKEVEFLFEKAGLLIS